MYETHVKNRLKQDAYITDIPFHNCYCDYSTLTRLRSSGLFYVPARSSLWLSKLLLPFEKLWLSKCVLVLARGSMYCLLQETMQCYGLYRASENTKICLIIELDFKACHKGQSKLVKWELSKAPIKLKQQQQQLPYSSLVATNWRMKEQGYKKPLGVIEKESLFPLPNWRSLELGKGKTQENWSLTFYIG